jgi:putative DNA-binding protein
MSDDARNLGRIERWMQTVIMHPAGVQKGIASEDARRQLDLTADEIEKVVTRSNALTAAERLAIYSRAYHARLLECLRAEFPVLLHALGGELFDRFAFDYLEQHPSETYTLARLGEKFPRYLAETRPDRDAPQDSRESWPDFIIDLATLEREFSEVFDGPGVEGQFLVIESELMEALRSAPWPEVRLVTVPCLRLLTFRYPVNEYFAAVRKKENPDLAERADTFLAITRRNYNVFLYDLSQQQYELLGALIAGESVAQATSLAAKATRSDLCALATNVQEWLHDWTSLSFFSAVGKPLQLDEC